MPGWDYLRPDELPWGTKLSNKKVAGSKFDKGNFVNAYAPMPTGRVDKSQFVGNPKAQDALLRLEKLEPESDKAGWQNEDMIRENTRIRNMIANHPDKSDQEGMNNHNAALKADAEIRDAIKAQTRGQTQNALFQNQQQSNRDRAEYLEMLRKRLQAGVSDASVDLTPLLALTDAWTGSNLAQTYRPKKTEADKTDEMRNIDYKIALKSEDLRQKDEQNAYLKQKLAVDRFQKKQDKEFEIRKIKLRHELKKDEDKGEQKPKFFKMMESKTYNPVVKNIAYQRALKENGSIAPDDPKVKLYVPDVIDDMFIGYNISKQHGRDDIGEIIDKFRVDPWYRPSMQQ